MGDTGRERTVDQAIRNGTYRFVDMARKVVGRGPNLDRAIARFASAHAEQNERDHGRLAAAAASGKSRLRSGSDAERIVVLAPSSSAGLTSRIEG